MTPSHHATRRPKTNTTKAMSSAPVNASRRASRRTIEPPGDALTYSNVMNVAVLSTCFTRGQRHRLASTGKRRCRVSTCRRHRPSADETGRIGQRDATERPALVKHRLREVRVPEQHCLEVGYPGEWRPLEARVVGMPIGTPAEPGGGEHRIGSESHVRERPVCVELNFIEVRRISECCTRKPAPCGTWSGRRASTGRTSRVGTAQCP